MFVIEGVRKEMAGGGEVTLNGKKLPLHLELVNHSPDGFNWGYGGSGPSQLSFAIVYEFCKRVLKYPVNKNKELDKCYQVTCYISQAFKWQFIASIHQDRFSLKEEDISTFIKAAIKEYVR